MAPVRFLQRNRFLAAATVPLEPPAPPRYLGPILRKVPPMPAFLNSADPGFDAAFAALLGQKREEAEDVDAAVAQIIADVRNRGDAAVIDLTARFDRLTLTPETLAFTPAEIAAEIAKVSPEDRAALELAADRIRAYHERQKPHCTGG